MKTKKTKNTWKINTSRTGIGQGPFRRPAQYTRVSTTTVIIRTVPSRSPRHDQDEGILGRYNLIKYCTCAINLNRPSARKKLSFICAILGEDGRPLRKMPGGAVPVTWVSAIGPHINYITEDDPVVATKQNYNCFFLIVQILYNFVLLFDLQKHA